MEDTIQVPKRIWETIRLVRTFVSESLRDAVKLKQVWTLEEAWNTTRFMLLVIPITLYVTNRGGLHDRGLDQRVFTS